MRRGSTTPYVFINTSTPGYSAWRAGPPPNLICCNRIHSRILGMAKQSSTKPRVLCVRIHSRMLGMARPELHQTLCVIDASTPGYSAWRSRGSTKPSGRDGSETARGPVASWYGNLQSHALGVGPDSLDTIRANGGPCSRAEALSPA